ncbi:hypothetical protein SynROS8604_00416 [Synechococcus sp. ROS8604]|nr:hypothetical protein SynROS8604_00416 [Synechococcus sp. ROS8604]
MVLTEHPLHHEEQLFYFAQMDRKLLRSKAMIQLIQTPHNMSLVLV